MVKNVNEDDIIESQIYPETEMTVIDKIMSYGFHKKEAVDLIVYSNFIPNLLEYMAKADSPVEKIMFKKPKGILTEIAKKYGYKSIRPALSDIEHIMLTGGKHFYPYLRDFLISMFKDISLPKSVVHMSFMTANYHSYIAKSLDYKYYIDDYIKERIKIDIHKFISNLKMWLLEETQHNIDDEEIAAFQPSGINLYYAKDVVDMLYNLYKFGDYSDFLDLGVYTYYSKKSIVDYLIYNIKKLMLVDKYNKCSICSEKGLFVNKSKKLSYCSNCYKKTIKPISGEPLYFVFCMEFLYSKNIYMIISREDYKKVTGINNE